MAQLTDFDAVLLIVRAANTVRLHKRNYGEEEEVNISRSKRTLLGFKNDKDAVVEKKSDNRPVFQNKEKVLVTCSRRIIYRYRHLMLNVVSLLPYCKKNSKVESKASKGATLNELWS